MKLTLLISLAALATAGASYDAKAACNIRGEFCGYPGWAANAFSNPRDRVPDSALDYPTQPWVGEAPPPRRPQIRQSRERDRYRYR